MPHEEVEAMLQGLRPDGVNMFLVNGQEDTRQVTPDYSNEPNKRALERDYRRRRGLRQNPFYCPEMEFNPIVGDYMERRDAWRSEKR